MDESEVNRNKYDKYHIPIVDIYQTITDSELCVDIFHEELRYRQKVLTGGRELQNQNLNDDRGRYTSYHSIIDSYGYGRYAYNWDAKPSYLNNTFFHYGEFRVGKSANFLIWDLLQSIDTDYKTVQPALDKTGFNSESLELLLVN